MNQKIMAVCDEDSGYVFKLQEYFKSRNLPFKMQVFTKPDQFSQFGKENKIEILLSTEDFYEQVEDCDVGHVYVLKETPSYQKKGVVCINRYQSCEKIIKEMTSEYSASGGSLFSGNEERAQMIGIYSPVKRCLQSSFAMLLGEMLGKRKKVLYLTLEAYPGYSELKPGEGRYGLSDLLYMLRNCEDKVVDNIGNMVTTIQHMDYLFPAVSYLDLETAKGREIEKLLNILAAESSYQYLILDLADHLHGLFQILQMCDKIYTITREDGLAMAKVEQYEYLLTREQYDDILEKTRKCKLPQFEQIPQKIEQLPYSQLAKYVRDVIREDFDEFLS